MLAKEPPNELRAALARLAGVALVSIAFAREASADDSATSLLTRAATAASQQNYVGTVVYQRGNRFESTRLIHLNDRGIEQEKIINLEGPRVEVIRTPSEVRCYYPDVKVIRMESPSFRNAFPSLSAQQQNTLIDFYEVRKAETERIAGRDAQAWVFEPKDGQRYAHKVWTDIATGILLKARIVNERDEVLEQFGFMDIALGVPIDRTLVQSSFGVAPPDWHVHNAGGGNAGIVDTGWTATKLPAGFARTAEGFRPVQGRRPPVAHIVYSDGLVAVSVFVEPIGPPPHMAGPSQQGAVNVYARQTDDTLVTVLGEVPAATVRDIANSVARR